MNETFGRCLRRVRVRQGWKSCEIAKAMLIDKTNYSKIESGKRKPWRHPRDILRLLLILGPNKAEAIELLNLHGKAHDIIPIDVADKLKKNPELIELIREYELHKN